MRSSRTAVGRRQQQPPANGGEIWQWRKAVVESELPATTRHVCLTIALHLSHVGKPWDIPIRRLIDETGLSNRAVAEHLQKAVDAEFLSIKRNYAETGHRAVSTYTALIPLTGALSDPASPSLSDPASPSAAPGSLSLSDRRSRQYLLSQNTSHLSSAPARAGEDEAPRAPVRRPEVVGALTAELLAGLDAPIRRPAR